MRTRVGEGGGGGNRTGKQYSVRGGGGGHVRIVTPFARLQVKAARDRLAEPVQPEYDTDRRTSETVAQAAL